MDRKASLSLSINAIVILVLAITMLGLGLAFTKGMFGKLSSKLSVPEPDIPATAEDTIVLPTEELTITKFKQFVFSANAYNDDFTGDVMGWLHCDSDGNSDKLDICSPPQKIPPGEDKGFKFIIEKENVEKAGTRICTIKFFDADSTHQCGTDPPSTSAVESKQVVVIVK